MLSVLPRKLGAPINGRRAPERQLRASLLVAMIISAAGIGSALSAECNQSANAACAVDSSVRNTLMQEVATNPTPDALFRLGQYFRGISSAFQDKLRATWYLQRAANAGSGLAMIELADMLFKGEGIASNPAKALALLEDAAKSDQRKAALAMLSRYSASTSGADPSYPVGNTRAAAQAPTADAPPAKEPPISRHDPASLLVGRRLSLQETVKIAYQAGFTTEKSLVSAVSVAIAESQLFSAARNWQPKAGYRPSTDAILVKGPPSVWFDNRQMQSDRGLWQISSKAWPQYPDSVTDNPEKAAAVALVLSEGGTDFSAWDSYRFGTAQRHFDRARGGWPAVRPVVRAFLSATARS